MAIGLDVSPVALDSASELRERFDAFLPNLLTAAGLLLLGIVLGMIARVAVARLLRRWAHRLASDQLAPGADIEAELRRTSLDEATIGLASRLAFLLVLVVFVAAAAEALQLPLISDWLLGLANYLPSVLASIVIFLLGLLLGAVANRVITRAAVTANIAYADSIGRAAQLAIVAVALIVAIDQLGVEAAFLITAASIILAATVGAVALSFGLGARQSVGNIVATHYLTQAYREGQRIRVADYEGEILEIGPTAVVLDTGSGRVRIPSSLFEDGPSTLVDG